MINKKFRCRLEVITPLHVGAASEKHFIEGIDYFYDKSKKEVVFISHEHATRHLGIDTWSSLLLRGDHQVIRNKISSHPHRNDMISKKVPLHNEPGTGIKAMIKNGFTGRPLCPGSSIKGALRSVLFNYLRGPNDRSNDAVFGSLNDHNDFMRFIRIGDAEFEESILITAKIFSLYKTPGSNEWQGGWKHSRNGNTNNDFRSSGFTTTYEVIAEGKKADFDLMISDKLFDLLHSNTSINRLPNYQRKNDLIHGSINDLFRIINNYTRQYIDAEINYFQRFDDAEFADTIIENYKDFLRPFLRESNSCLMRMASGSGFHAITGNWQRPDHVSTIQMPINGKIYKTRRISFESSDEGYVLLPMGFVLITCLQN